MSRGQKPLLWMMALTLPGASHALGLGDIHVDSKLNEPLNAQIDIVGATADELTALRAALANREAFQRFGFDRPSFLASTTFKVAKNDQGQPVLQLRSSDSFTDPLINILVDVQWGNGEVIRQYTLLLDPAGVAAQRAATDTALAAVQKATQPVNAARLAAAQPTAAQPTAASATTAATAAPAVASIVEATPSTGGKVSRYKIGAKATLRGIAWRTGARSQSDLRRMMVAIFRANPSAFQGNINRLRRGAFVNIPSAAEVSAIPRAEANREIRAQMAAWHTAGKPAAPSDALPAPALAVAAPAPTMLAPVTVTAVTATAAAVTATPAVAAAPAQASVPETAPQLSVRIQSLEQSLDQLHRELQTQNVKMQSVQAQVRRAEESAPAVAVAAATPVDALAAPAQSPSSVLASVIAGVGLLCAAIAAGYFAVLRRATKSKESRKPTPKVVEQPPVEQLPPASDIVPYEPPISAAESSIAQGDDSATQELPAAIPAPMPAAAAAQSIDDTRPLPMISTAAAQFTRASDDTTVSLPAVDFMDDTAVLDLISTAHHVHMPSALHEQQQVMKERRTNLVDVLRKAIEREPERHDLRLKLLELYFGAAATNRQGFLDVVKKFAEHRDVLADGEWAKIASMGRQILPDSPLFSSSADDDKLAECA
jgi:pilus assembly protein FimV